MSDVLQIMCRYCHSSIPVEFYFCPNCGKMLKEKTTISRQIVVYFVCVFVPPFGFWYVWKFLRQPDRRSKKIGIAALILTVISTTVSIWFSIGFINEVMQQINALNSGVNYNF